MNAPMWRHDAYTLRKLVTALRSVISALVSDGLLTTKSTVVDIGAGDAPYRPLFAPHCAKYLACDLTAGPQVDIVFKPGEALDFATGSADCVVSFQVLEHVWDIDAYLAECRRVLAPDGRLILSTHGTWLYHPHPTDYRRWTCDGLRKELEVRGFEVLDTLPVVGPLAWTTQFRTLAYHHVLSRLGPIGKLVAAGFCTLMYGRMLLEDLITPKPLRETNAAIYMMVARPRLAD
jgi:SAM-dependent methyltransferase